MEDIGKLLILFGIVMAVVGGGLVLFSMVPGLSRLPGDIVIQRDNFSCIFPLATSILLSIVLTVVLNLIIRFINK